MPVVPARPNHEDHQTKKPDQTGSADLLPGTQVDERNKQPSGGQLVLLQKPGELPARTDRLVPAARRPEDPADQHSQLV